MRQPKNGLINHINNQGNRSDNDAPQDQCCFIVFMSFSGGLGGSQVLWVGQQQTVWVPEIVSCGSAGLGAGLWFIFWGVLDFVNGGADTGLWYCSVLFYVFRLPAFLEGS